jgi:hypothetical protein
MSAKNPEKNEFFQHVEFCLQDKAFVCPFCIATYQLHEQLSFDDVVVVSQFICFLHWPCVCFSQIPVALLF